MTEETYMPKVGAGLSARTKPTLEVNNGCSAALDQWLSGNDEFCWDGRRYRFETPSWNRKIAPVRRS